MSWNVRTWSVFVLCATAAAVPPRMAAAADLYHVTQSVSLGAPDRWDYLSYEPASRRLYVTHGNTIDVLDGRTGSVLGKVAVPGANGIAFGANGRGYAGSRDHKSVVVFDLQSLRIVKEIAADEDTDAVLYEPSSQRVFVMEGDPHRALVIDSTSDSVAGRIELGGSPEFAVADGAGKVFINIEDQRAIVRIDARSLKVEARWPVPSCESPHGLAFDQRTHHLFASCVNSRVVVVDALDGHVLAEVPIGKGSDGAAFDPKRGLAFSSNGEGTVSVIHAGAAGGYEPLGTIMTMASARTISLDAQSGRLYLTCGERIEVDPAATNPRKRYGIKPGSVRVLFLDPVS
jgi:DNA-binding beta-propeller fold protein YncE